MTSLNRTPLHPNSSPREKGVAMIIMMLIIVLGLIGIFTYRLDRKGPEQNADRQTGAALAQAKEALLGYAASDPNRPGTLPCADLDNDGSAATLGVDLSCSPAVIGRLPWKLLRIPDLRDGSGERLWYAVSPNFRSNVTALTSASTGQISLRDAQGTIIYDASGTPSSGLVAIIIAPGEVIQRQDSGVTQDRSCIGGGGCTSDDICLSPVTAVAKCNPSNYLDVLVGVEDNTDFVASTTNGFISGKIIDAAGTRIVNDRIITITASELFSGVTYRMIRSLASFWNGSGYFPTASPFPPSSFPPIWTAPPAKWDLAIANVQFPSPTLVTIQFKNCNALYTINASYSVTRTGQC